MEEKVPDLNDTYVEPLFWYSLDKGYMCPDSVDGFDDEVESGLVSTPRVRIPFDQQLADSHEKETKKCKMVVLDENEGFGLVEDAEYEGGFESWLKHDVMGGKTLSVEERETAKRKYEVWKDYFVMFCPSAMDLPDYKGGGFLNLFILSMLYLVVY